MCKSYQIHPNIRNNYENYCHSSGDVDVSWIEPEEGVEVICTVCGETVKYNSMFPCLQCGEYQIQIRVVPDED